MTDPMRTCPVPGCEEKHARSKLMCVRHWYGVPKPLRDELWRAYRSEGVLGEDYLEAREACIEAVTP